MGELEHVRAAGLDALVEQTAKDLGAAECAYVAGQLAEVAGMKLYEEKCEQPEGTVAVEVRQKRRYIHGPADLTHPRTADPPGFGA